MTRIPLIKSVMTPFPYSIDVDDTVDNASKMMVEHDIHHLPVTDKGKPVGVISLLDIKRTLDQQSARAGKDKHLVRHIANLDSYIVDLATPLDNVVLEMADRHIATALIVKQGRLVGIFTSSDAFSYLGRLLSALFPRGSDDAA
jgi:acetoin utilization protein AcuB